MPSKYNRQYAYMYEVQKALKGIALPDKLKCDRCNKFVAQAGYSNKQLSDAKLAVKERGVGATYMICCRHCTNTGQFLELECVMCHETKCRDEFAKAQRSKPDTAKCFKCMEKQLEMEPVAEATYDSHRTQFEPTSTSAALSGKWEPNYWTSTTSSAQSMHGCGVSDAGSDNGGISLVKPFTNFNMANLKTKSETLISTDDDFPVMASAYSSMNGGPKMAGDDGRTVSKGKSSWYTESTGPTTSAFNPNGYGKPSMGFGSGSITGTIKTFASNAPEPSENEVTYGKSGFAKIKAYKPQVKEEEEQEEDDWKSDSEGSEREDDDDDDDDCSDDSEAEL